MDPPRFGAGGLFGSVGAELAPKAFPGCRQGPLASMSPAAGAASPEMSPEPPRGPAEGGALPSAGFLRRWAIMPFLGMAHPQVIARLGHTLFLGLAADSDGAFLG